jgi:hypothetical protein
MGSSNRSEARLGPDRFFVLSLPLTWSTRCRPGRIGSGKRALVGWGLVDKGTRGPFPRVLVPTWDFVFSPRRFAALSRGNGRVDGYMDGRMGGCMDDGDDDDDDATDPGGRVGKTGSVVGLSSCVLTVPCIVVDDGCVLCYA